MITIILYLAVAMYYWDIFWIADIGSLGPVTRVCLFIVTLCFILFDIMLKEIISE